ncbi:BON domain-containing protein [Paraburkholderia silvatlantica]|uniref:Osmotically-inducible protein OsmY n=1 Tax=Paraburkholderia silvatlantica TaxID=321895 RepID=A0ABR6FM35_9BURK|nr:BON domain-containing protein [Paraburkholderia silvatlantica]MBB2928108.1 osmotically-inducible protein OsmY [Paraburkholderia silvatlantica]PVY31070.1 BON domain-containing protein [Paraburkholderia silvatlantica]PXW37206.1 BON domain-containing protein [Paraburkholderia silvatlantica]
MRSNSWLSAVAIAVLFASASYAYAQESGVATIPPIASASKAAPSTKAQRKAQHQANRKLEKSVRNALVHTDGLQMYNVNVLARNGRVDLVGSVPDEAQIQRAGDVARAVPGVVSLNNALHIRVAGH